VFSPGGDRPAAGGAGSRWWPDWRNPLTWQLGLLAGSVNSIYFATNFFLPDYLIAAGERDRIDATLTILNLGQLPGSLLMIAFAGRMIRRSWSYSGSALLTLAGLAGMLLAGGAWILPWALLFGFAATVTFVLTFALPSLLSPSQDVHRVSAGMFTISYSCAVLTPVIGGILWQVGGRPVLAFLPILAWPLVTVVVCRRLPLSAPDPR